MKVDIEKVKTVCAKNEIEKFEVKDAGVAMVLLTETIVHNVVLLQLMNATGVSWVQERTTFQTPEAEQTREQIEFGSDKVDTGKDAESPKAMKFDTGKPMLGLISSIFQLGLARVLTYGATKYNAHNWRKGFVWSRPYDALQRHLVAWNMGEDLDPETKMSHLDHAACELMFLRELTETHKSLDDRHKSNSDAYRIPTMNVETKLVTHTSAPESGLTSVEGEWMLVTDEQKQEKLAFVPKMIRAKNEQDLPKTLFHKAV